MALTQCVADSSRRSAPFATSWMRCGNESVLTVTGPSASGATEETVNPNAADRPCRGRQVARDRRARIRRRPAAAPGQQRGPITARRCGCAYRYLDLRREKMQRNIALRSDVIASIRQRMIAQGFREFQTPVLTAGSAPRARATSWCRRACIRASFYALPQAPQQFKQLLMIAGFDRYFQIAPCFRDEDAARRPFAGRVLPARHRDELRDPGGRVRGHRAGAAPACSRSSAEGKPAVIDRRTFPTHRPSSTRASMLKYGGSTSRTCAIRSRSPT